MKPQDRFKQLVSETYGTQTEFGKRYGIARRTVAEWSAKGPPTWVFVVLEDVKRARKDRDTLTALNSSLRAVLGPKGLPSL